MIDTASLIIEGKGQWDEGFSGKNRKNRSYSGYRDR